MNNLISQTFLNGDFEINSATGCSYNLKDSIFNSKISNVYAFGIAQLGDGSADINTFNCYVNPQRNKWCISVDATSTGRDEVAIELSSNLINGSPYNLSFWIFGNFTQPYYKRVDLELGASNSNKSFGSLIQTITPDTQKWKYISFVYIPSSSPQYITVRNKMIGFTAWNQIDNFTIFPCSKKFFGKDTSLCIGDTLVLDVTTPGSSYKWQDSSSNAIYKVYKDGTYIVRLYNGCGMMSDTIQVSFKPIPTLNLGKDTSICKGQSILLEDSLMGATYLWQDHSTNSSFAVTDSGLYCLQLSLNGCSARDTIHITQRNKPSINLGTDTSLCEKQSLLLKLHSPNTSYVWQDNSTDSFYRVTKAGSYWVVASNSCGATLDSITVSYKALPHVNLGKDTSLCMQDSLVLQSINPGSSYLWQDLSRDSIYTVKQAGIYWLQLTKNMCSQTDTIQISYKPLPVFDLGKDTTICSGDSLIIQQAVANASYLWQDQSVASSFTIKQAGIYWLKMSIAACSAIDSIHIFAKNCEIVYELPNVFTPNSDGFNDVFKPIKMLGISTSYLSIYNRWGQKVFESNTASFAWDGSQEGDACSTGVYYWILQYTDTNKHEGYKTGTVTLLK